MTLQEKLDAFEARVAPKFPKEALEIMHRAVEDVRGSGLLETTLKVGDTAPDFTLPNDAGRPVSCRELRARGPLVVSFFRGRW